MPSLPQPAPRISLRAVSGRFSRQRPQSGSSSSHSNAIDFRQILGDFNTPAPRRRSDNDEVDLSVSLDNFRQPAAVEQPASDDMDGLFAQLREDASRRSAMDVAEQEYKQGLDLYRKGQIDECILPLQAAPGRRAAVRTASIPTYLPDRQMVDKEIRGLNGGTGAGADARRGLPLAVRACRRARIVR